MSEPTQHDLAAIADRYAAAWIARDPEAIVALHAPDSTFQAHGRGAQVKGKPALQKEFAGIFERYPNFGVEIHRLLLGDTHWTLDWTLTFQPEGKERRGFHALDVVEVDDAGLVARKDTFFDFAQVKAAMESTA
ncbi:nuclear transport factor 2 family protein [Ramlibacter sp.]|uniref:nuclear transport factor 2 family protein n=1 Tax=Ramlibacter sp. TaxID=1917967 RepID=UPI0017ADCAAB|nr:nuclear transport factor 2 family protein [Ramlibacter sp.]MBA2672753.1 nuclear transport factor 2 family protein [Ramlibacter sp.]